MNRNVAIVGYGQTKYESNKDSSREKMVFDATKSTLKSAGLTKADIDTVIGASNDYLDGRTISNVHTVVPLGSDLKDESKVEMDGAFAALYAYMRILSGDHDVALVVGESMASCYPPYIPGILTLDVTYDYPMGFLNEISAAGLQARCYMDKYDVSEEEIAKVSVKNLKNAAKNPFALRQMPKITTKKVLNSKMLYSPIRELNAYPLTDGACGILLASEERAREITDNPVWIEGVGNCHDTYYLGERTLSGCDSLKLAAENAYEMAGIDNPKREIDLAEVHENFSHEELISYEVLGFCGEGEGKKLIDEGVTEMDGDLPVNPSGGALSANPLCATGLVRIAEAAMQIRGDAGEHQVKDVKTALAHGQNGISAQENVVFILRGE
jgi:acetyl-CoA C-acetyltransferase